jgi:NADH-quinone oxidoreductase subunit E/NADP-reducing hydrogenase subunit HndA
MDSTASLTSIHTQVSRSGVGQAPYEQPLFSELDAAMVHYAYRPEALIQILHRAQELFGYLREDVVDRIARELRLPISRINGVIGFYSYFSKVPTGKHTIQVCTGTACYVRGAEQLLRVMEKQLGISDGGTTMDGRFSLRCARCVGACGQAPVVMIGDDVHAELRSNRVKQVLRNYK